MTRYAIAALLSATILTSTAAAAPAQSSDLSTSARTSLLGETRFEIITLAETSETYRLDRISGEVWVLQRSESRFTAMTLAWKALPMPPGEEGPVTVRVNFQLVLSERSNFPLLMNVHTGATWTLRTAARDVKWEAVTIER